MSKGVSNFETEKRFKEINDEDIHEKFLGVFPSDKINKFIMFEKMMLGKKYPFIISAHNYRYKQRKWHSLVEYFEHFTKGRTFIF